MLVGAVVGGIIGGLAYARYNKNGDGDFTGLSIPLYIGGGVLAGSLIGYVVSVGIESSGSQKQRFYSLVIRAIPH